MWCDDKAGSRQGRSGHREREDGDPESPHLPLARGYGGAWLTDPDDRGMCQVGAEPVLLAQPPGERCEDLEVDLLLGAAPPADEVPVALGIGPEPPRHAVVEVRVRHVAELLEHLQVAVDGGWIDLRMARADPPRALLGRRLMARALQRLQHQTALDRHATTLRADVVGEAHTASVAQSPASCNIPLLR